MIARRGVPRPVTLGFCALTVACTAASQTREPSIERLTIASQDATLAATLHLPRGARPVPAVVLVHGSGRMTGDDVARFMAPRLLAMGVAVLAYDKRGVGESTGAYSGIGPANSIAMFHLLAADALAGVDALAKRRDIDRARIGLVGNSQGGWIAPLAASTSRAVAFVVSLSGPAVTVGEEIAYSNLAGADPGSQQGLADDEIDRRFRAFTGPHGYDPVPVIRALRTPTLWILGERDRSLPVARSIANLERIRDGEGRPITLRVIPGADHSLRNPVTGERPDIWGIVGAWLRERRILL
jgi:dipeptidyl aminopeptidase/acylaminoacyl peptidase